MSSIASASQAQLGQQIAISLMSKAQDVAKQHGEATVSMIQEAAEMQKELAAQTGRGVNLDVRG